MSYRFPFNTCEPLHNGPIAQPISAAINLVSTAVIILLCFVHKPRPAVVGTLVTYAIFEAWHTWSHAIHIPGRVQKRVVHILGLAMAFATLGMIQSLSNHAPLGSCFLTVLALLVAVDALAVTNGSDLLGIATGLAIFSWVVVGRWQVLPNPVRRALVGVLPGVALLLLLFVNEAANCSALLEWKRLPYHALVEMLGLVLFVWVSHTWIVWDRLVSGS